VTNGPVNEFDAANCWTRAEKELVIARDLLDREHFDAVVGHSYYAMFYAATAVLAGRGIRCKTHQGVIRQVGRCLVLPGVVSKEEARTLEDAFLRRQRATYDFGEWADREHAERQLAASEVFVAKMKEVLGPG
jgi:uncharacterized protein (UPF0332 family)